MSDFLPAQSIDWDQGGAVGIVRYGTDSRKIVQFYRSTARNGERAIADGEPPYIGVDYVKMWEPGERNLWVIDRPASDLDKHRFPDRWRAYLDGREQVPDGTPVEALFGADPDVLLRLKQLSFHTIQQLAGASEQAITKIGMGARGYVAKAVEFIEATQNHDQFAAIKAQMDDMRKQLEEQQLQNADLLQKLNTRKEKA
jgi:hypothetical protein